jgi:hypothetical protein
MLAAAVGGAAAMVAHSIGRPIAAQAADGDPLLIGAENQGTSTTTLSAGIGNGSTLVGTNPQQAGIGVTGASTAGGAGVFARSDVGSGTPASPAEMAATGLYGYAGPTSDPDLVAAGVWGDSGDIGVFGSGNYGIVASGAAAGISAAGGNGIEALGDNTGVYAEGANIGVRAISPNVALRVEGKLQILNRSGKLSVAAGASSVSRSVSGVTSASIVLAVLQTAEAGTWVRAAVATTNRITIYFNRSMPTSSSVGYLILN